MTIKLRLWWVSLLLCVSFSVLADSPAQILQQVGNRMIDQLQQNKSQLRNRAVIQRIVDNVLVPYIDINRMAGMVVGRQNWYSATPAVRHEFVRQFKRVVINTYANALATFNDDKVKVYPVRGGVQGRFASVNSEVIRRSGQRIPIDYKLINKSSHWKVYDFSIEGVSIVANYRSQFSGTLAAGGLKALVAKLQQYNR